LIFCLRCRSSYYPRQKTIFYFGYKCATMNEYSALRRLPTNGKKIFVVRKSYGQSI
jgi:hypothetical protein